MTPNYQRVQGEFSSKSKTDIWISFLTMYTLLSGLYKYMFQKDEYCILILGLDNAGKTTFLEQTKTKFSKNYKGINLSKITSTVGLNIGTIDVGKARLMFWDLGGQEELQSLWDKYYAESHGVIYVIDSTDEERLSESKEAFALQDLIPSSRRPFNSTDLFAEQSGAVKNAAHYRRKTQAPRDCPATTVK
ncbi:ADP-ribosylation factor-related protein 1 isoform X2 [Hippocampus zosterae]|uniref:ADP-ribosylation factor-related protein 1 isoform X2 n=1 Tax=Hippocampus zosterae TaxID=109293 RepID=UPI00223D1325|nr:ADP-ribosylation factor-related protein 1 isoform X2 [Hippocampus zosterae]